MGQYIDGFVFPILKSGIAEYKQVAEAVAAVYKEHGAVDYLEFIGDDMNREGTCSFIDMTNASESEVIVFGWIVFESKSSRDLVNRNVESDPRMAELVRPIMDPQNMIFDPTRMAYGGFKSLIPSVRTE